MKIGVRDPSKTEMLPGMVAKNLTNEVIERQPLCA